MRLWGKGSCLQENKFIDAIRYYEPFVKVNQVRHIAFHPRLHGTYVHLDGTLDCRLCCTQTPHSTLLHLDSACT